MKRAKFGPEAFEGLEGKLPMQYPRTIGPNAMKYLQEVVDSGLTRKSTMVERFERAFAEELGVKHCIATPGCNPALSALAAAFPFEPGDEIIVSSITDYGSIHGLIKENYIPVFADTEPGTVNISAERSSRASPIALGRFSASTRPESSATWTRSTQLAQKHGLIVYEDVCQAIFSQYKGRLAGTLGLAAGFSFDSEKTMGSDLGGCLVTDDDALAERIRFMGQSRGGVMEPGFGRKHVAAGHAFRMPFCTAAICLAQLEIIREQVAQRDRMVRLLSRLVAEIPGVRPLPIPDYLDVYSAWMFSFNIDPAQFRCTTDEFAKQLAEAGIPGAGTGKYYLMPVAVTFLDDNAQKKVYPYSMPPASREYRYDAEDLSERLEVCPDLDSLVDVLREVHRGALRIGRPDRLRRGGEESQMSAVGRRQARGAGRRGGRGVSVGPAGKRLAAGRHGDAEIRRRDAAGPVRAFGFGRRSSPTTAWRASTTRRLAAGGGGPACAVSTEAGRMERAFCGSGIACWKCCPWVDGEPCLPGDCTGGSQRRPVSRPLPRGPERRHSAGKEGFLREDHPDLLLPYVRQIEMLCQSADEVGTGRDGSASRSSSFGENLDSRLWPRLPKAVTHGDIHPGNVRFRNSQVAAVYDFDYLSVQARVHDIAHALIFFAARRDRRWTPTTSARSPSRFVLDGDLSRDPAGRLSGDQFADRPWSGRRCPW